MGSLQREYLTLGYKKRLDKTYTKNSLLKMMTKTTLDLQAD
jgi:hypothetical protein